MEATCQPWATSPSSRDFQVAGELADPEPRLTRGGLGGDLQCDGLTIEGELLDRGGGGDGAKGHPKQSEEEAGHGRRPR